MGKSQRRISSNLSSARSFQRDARRAGPLRPGAGADREFVRGEGIWPRYHGARTLRGRARPTRGLGRRAGVAWLGGAAWTRRKLRAISRADHWGPNVFRKEPCRSLPALEGRSDQPRRAVPHRRCCPGGADRVGRALGGLPSSGVALARADPPGATGGGLADLVRGDRAQRDRVPDERARGRRRVLQASNSRGQEGPHPREDQESPPWTIRARRPSSSCCREESSASSLLGTTPSATS